MQKQTDYNITPQNPDNTRFSKIICGVILINLLILPPFHGDYKL